MAKYSTGSSAGGGGTTCELCGAESDSLRQATVAGAQLQVCPNCAPHSEESSQRSKSGGGSSGQGSRTSRKKKAAQNVAKANPIWDGDSEHWEKDGTNYDDDPLPYLVTSYGERLESARQDAGYKREELAEELGCKESDLLAIEQGRATQAGVGGGLISALEELLDIELAE